MSTNNPEINIIPILWMKEMRLRDAKGVAKLA